MIRRTFLALTAATAFAMPAFAQDKDIVDTAVAAGNFNTLAAALTAAGLVETLKGEGPFTVFAPTDAAFAALPAGTVEDLLKPENKDKLVAVLTYHVVPGKVMSTDLTEGMKAATVNGAEVTITLEGGPKVNGAVISRVGKGSSGSSMTTSATPRSRSASYTGFAYQLGCRNSKACRPSGRRESVCSSRASSRLKFGGSCHSVGPSLPSSRKGSTPSKKRLTPSLNLKFLAGESASRLMWVT